MAFEIGERVVNRFAGNGTIVGELFKVDADAEGKGGTAMQRVAFDNAALGEREWAVSKLEPLTDGGDIGA